MLNKESLAVNCEMNLVDHKQALMYQVTQDLHHQPEHARDSRMFPLSVQLMRFVVGPPMAQLVFENMVLGLLSNAPVYCTFQPAPKLADAWTHGETPHGFDATPAGELVRVRRALTSVS